jgi:hypothetical protein
LLNAVFGWDSVRFGLFLATFNGAFKAVQCALRRHRWADDKWNAAIAGAVAALALFFESPYALSTHTPLHARALSCLLTVCVLRVSVRCAVVVVLVALCLYSDRRQTWTLYLLARACDLLLQSSIARGWVPSFEHGDLLFFSLFSCHIMYCWHMEPHTMSKSFHRWISARGGLDDRQLAAIRNLINGDAVDLTSWCRYASPRDRYGHCHPSAAVLTDAVLSCAMLCRRDHKIAEYAPAERPALIPCEVFHPTCPDSCTAHAGMRYLLGLKSAWPVYTPVHVIPLLLFRARTLLKHPLSVTGQTALSIFYSCNFITSFQAIFWFVFCHSRNIAGVDNKLSTVAAGLAAGLSVLWEKKSRRSELALFTLSRNFDVLWNQLKVRGLVRALPGGVVWAFAFAMATIMGMYQHEPSAWKPHYYTFMQARRTAQPHTHTRTHALY